MIELRQILDDFYESGETPDIDEFRELLQTVTDEYPESQILKQMNMNDYNPILFPSYELYKTVPYPAFLARLLVKSNANESITDIYNVYYQRRKVSKQALDVFKKDLFSNPKKHKDIIESMEDDLKKITKEDKSGIIKEFIKKFYPEYL